MVLHQSWVGGLYACVVGKHEAVSLSERQRDLVLTEVLIAVLISVCVDAGRGAKGCSCSCSPWASSRWVSTLVRSTWAHTRLAGRTVAWVPPVTLTPRSLSAASPLDRYPTCCLTAQSPLHVDALL